MNVHVLGPLTLRCSGVVVTPTAPKLRQVLALLALNADRVVPTDSLLRELWDDEPPRSALTTLQTYVHKLRKIIDGPQTERPSREVVVTRSGGYLLSLREGDLDLERYTGLRRRGRAALAAGDAAAAAQLLREALSVWSGPPLVDVPGGRFIAAHKARLQESWLTTVEHFIEAQLLRGGHREMVSELAALTAEHPLHEDLHGQYMLALYRSGRRSEALDVYRRLRTTLVDECGLEPSPKLQRLHTSMLSTDPRMEEPARTGDAPGGTPFPSTSAYGF